MQTITNQLGTIHELTGEKLDDVVYSLTHAGQDDAYGSITLGDEPQPGYKFMGDPAFAGGQKTFNLVTANGSKVEISFSSSTGAFVCVLADQAKEALK
jgi:hypothetical protein